MKYKNNLWSKWVFAVFTVAIAACGGEPAISPLVGDQIETQSPIPSLYTKGKVSFTFDDGIKSIYEYALPILSAQNVPATAYITTDWIGKEGYMTWQQVRSLQNDYHWEIGSHTLSHPELPTVDHYAKEIVESKSRLVAQGLNVSTIATPYGAYDDRILRTITRHYTMHRGFWDRDDLNSFPYNSAILMVESVQRETSTQHVFNLMDRAKSENKWLILVFHEVLPEIIPDYEYTTLPEDLKSIVDYAVSIKLPVVTPNHMDKLMDHNLLSGPDTIVLSDAKQNPHAWIKDYEGIKIGVGSGRFPNTNTSVLFTGTNRNVHLFSPSVPVSYSKTYGVKSFADLLDLTSGEIGFHLDEYDAQGNWLSNVYLGNVAAGKVREHGSRYTPSSSKVSSARLQIYMKGGSQGMAVLDGLQMYRMP